MPGLCGMGRFGAETIYYGRENEPRADHQTGQPLFANVVRAGCEGDHDATEQMVRLQFRPLVDRSDGAQPMSSPNGSRMCRIC